MANSSIALDEPATVDKRVDTEQLVVATVTVERERMQIAGAADVEIARIINSAPAGSEYALVVRNIPSGTQTVSATDLDIRNLAKALDELYSVLRTDAGAAYDARDRNWTLGTGEQRLRNPGDTAFMGDATTPVRTDPTGTTAQPVTDNAGSLTVDGTVTTNVGTGTRPVAGDVAHDAIDSGNPVKIGGKASGALPAAVAAADRADAYFDREGRQIVRPWGAGDWTQVHAPAANTRATTTKAAGAAGVRHVCTGITVVLAAGATAPTAVSLQVRLRDGISDTGTILWESTISLPATAGAMNGITRSGLFIRGGAATAMTLEFSAAGGANTVESVSMEGVDITEA